MWVGVCVSVCVCSSEAVTQAGFNQTLGLLGADCKDINRLGCITAGRVLTTLTQRADVRLAFSQQM